jgi:hypothetical protein
MFVMKKNILLVGSFYVRAITENNLIDFSSTATSDIIHIDSKNFTNNRQQNTGCSYKKNRFI